jgi:hypothetical protein
MLREKGRAENFAHPAIIDLLKQFYYNGKMDCLSVIFPKAFKTCPKACLAMACACVGFLLMCSFFTHCCLIDC